MQMNRHRMRCQSFVGVMKLGPAAIKKSHKGSSRKTRGCEQRCQGCSNLQLATLWALDWALPVVEGTWRSFELYEVEYCTTESMTYASGFIFSLMYLLMVALIGGAFVGT